MEGLLGRDRRNLFGGAGVMDMRALFVERDNQRLDLAGDLFDRPTRFVAHQFGFVIVDSYVSSKFNHAAQRLTVEQRQTLTRIENKRHAGPRQMLGMLGHGSATVRPPIPDPNPLPS